MRLNLPTATFRNVLLVCLLVVAVGIVATSENLYAAGQELIAACELIIEDFPRLGMLLFLLLAAASSMLAFFSSAILVPVGIAAWGIGWCFTLLWAGWFLGGVAAYGVGRYLGRAIVVRLLGERRLSELERRVGEHAGFLHIVLFQSMLPSEVPGYVLGSLRYPLLSFAAALALVELPYAVGTIYIGDSFLERRGWLLIAAGAAGVLVLAIAYQLYRHSVKQRPTTHWRRVSRALSSARSDRNRADPAARRS
jgi:uncharacterized membrane protein YdjX (TVP38/TMEM64 family)